MPEAENNGAYHVYMIECENGAYYTGIALDMEDRMRRHFRGTGHSKYTRSFRARRLLACWKISGTRGDALKVESRIKRGGRKFKESIIALPSSLEEMVLRELDLKIEHEKTPLPENHSGDETTRYPGNTDRHQNRRSRIKKKD